MWFQKRLNVEKVKGYIPVASPRHSPSLPIFCPCFSWCFTCYLPLFSEMLDGCRALLAITTVTTPLVFDKLLKSVRSVTWCHTTSLDYSAIVFVHKSVQIWLFALIFSPIGTISLLSSLMCEVIKVLMANYSEEETWSWVARDILLDTWTSLLVVLFLDL